MSDNEQSVRADGRSQAVQRRGVERVAAILDAAESLLAEKGYAAATLKAIGEQSGIPTASLYHYFADRGQVDTELLRRHGRALNERYAATLDNLNVRTLGEGVDAMIDPMLSYFRDNPAFVQLWFGNRSSTIATLGHEFDVSWAERLWHFVVDKKLVRADTPRIALDVVFEVGNRLLDIAFQRSPTGDDSTIDEMRRLLTAYLQTYAPVRRIRRA